MMACLIMPVFIAMFCGTYRVVLFCGSVSLASHAHVQFHLLVHFGMWMHRTVQPGVKGPRASEEEGLTGLGKRQLARDFLAACTRVVDAGWTSAWSGPQLESLG